MNKVLILPSLLRTEADQQNIHKMCELLWQAIGAANRYVDAQAPWTLKNNDTDRMNTVLYILIDVIRHLSIMTSPIVPLGSSKIMDQLNLSEDERDFAALKQPLTIGKRLPAPHVIFPRFEKI